ncbi:MAG: DUF3795 domain-containing protein [Clostridia bacterium]|nr:DUF3795 domain-containing protein [Clostridia bacterium]
MDTPKETSAVCGLYCDSCGIYIATTEEPGRLPAIAASKGTTSEGVRCLGCRSAVLYPFCRDCRMKACAARKGIDFCGSCDEYPCGILQDFQRLKPHRIELFESLEDIRDHGEDAWRARMDPEYRCAACGTVNTIYDLECRNCGHVPSNPYAGRHRAEIDAYLADRG